MKKNQLNICDEWKVALQIYEQTEINKSTITFSQLVDQCEGFGFDRHTVSNVLDYFSDKSMVDGKWEKVGKNNVILFI